MFQVGHELLEPLQDLHSLELAHGLQVGPVVWRGHRSVLTSSLAWGRRLGGRLRSTTWCATSIGPYELGQVESVGGLAPHRPPPVDEHHAIVVGRARVVPQAGRNTPLYLPRQPRTLGFEKEREGSRRETRLKHVVEKEVSSGYVPKSKP